MLAALAQIERECAGICAAAAERLEERHLRGELSDLRNDHLRHLEALNRLIFERQGAPLTNVPSSAASEARWPRPPAARAGAPPGEVLAGVLRREAMGAGAYENALLHPWDRASRTVLDTNAWDQQRHIRLLEAHTRALVPPRPTSARAANHRHEPVHFND